MSAKTIESIVTAPPGSPGAKLYAIAGPATGAFAGQEGLIASPVLNGSWLFFRPEELGNGTIYLTASPTIARTYDPATESWVIPAVSQIVEWTATIANGGSATIAGVPISKMIGSYIDVSGNPTVIDPGTDRVSVYERTGEIKIDNNSGSSKDVTVYYLA